MEELKQYFTNCCKLLDQDLHEANQIESNESVHCENKCFHFVSSAICGWRGNRVLLVIGMVLGVCIAYADRANLSTAIIPMAKEFNYSIAIEGAIIGSFFYG